MPTQSANDRLDGWKDIGAHLSRHPRTAMRWAEERNLPVHRVPGGDRQSVFAYRHEIDRWLNRHADENDSIVAASLTEKELMPKLVATPKTVETPAFRGQFLRNSRVAITTGIILSGAILLMVGHFMKEPAIELAGSTQLSDDGTAKRGLVTDGKRLYFSEIFGSELLLSTMSVKGGPIRRMEGPKSPVPEDISPDGKLLLVLSREGYEEEHTLWIVPTGGEAFYQFHGVRCQAAAWSPDGKWIAYAAGDVIYLISRDGSSLRRLSQFPGVPRTLRWSRNGKRLMSLIRDAPASFSLWQMDLDADHNVLRIVSLRSEGTNCCREGSLAGDGNAYFSVAADLTQNRILYLRLGRRWPEKRYQESNIGTHLGKIVSLASDVDARKIYFLSHSKPRGDLVRFDQSAQTFTLFLSGIAAQDVDFARSMNWIAYVKALDNTLWVSRRNGSEARQVTPAGMNVELPRWSPDSKVIAFMGKLPDRPWRIFLVPATHGAPKEVVNGSDNQGAPTWSPDGRFLAYGNVGCQEEHTCAVHILNLATSTVTTLPDSQGLGTARWSPDGRQIAALNPERRELYLFDFHHGKWHKIADSTNGNDLCWSMDSRYVYTHRSIKGHNEIVRAPAGGGDLQTVLKLDSFNEAAGYLDTWFYLTPDNAIILNRWLTASEIFSRDYKEN